jgi:hypothetical protein
MFKDDIRVDESAAEPRGVDRRTIAMGVAWTVPVVIVATAAPAAAASPPPPTPSAQVGQPLVAFTKVVGGGKDTIKHIDFTLTFANTGTASATVDVLMITSTGDGAYASGLSQALIVGPGASVSTPRLIVWNYGAQPKSATYTINYKVDDGQIQSAVITA